MSNFLSILSLTRREKYLAVAFALQQLFILLLGRDQTATGAIFLGGVGVLSWVFVAAFLFTPPSRRWR